MSELFTTQSIVSAIHSYNLRHHKLKNSRLNLTFDIGFTINECGQRERIGPYDKTIPGLLSAMDILNPDQRRYLGTIICDICSSIKDEGVPLESIDREKTGLSIQSYQFRRRFTNKLANALYIDPKYHNLITLEAITVGVPLMVSGHNDLLNDHRKGFNQVVAAHICVSLDAFNAEERLILIEAGCKSEVPFVIILYTRSSIGAAVDSRDQLMKSSNNILIQYFTDTESDPSLVGYLQFLQYQLEDATRNMTIKKDSDFKGYANYSLLESFNKMRFYSIFIFMGLELLKFLHSNAIYSKYDEISIVAFCGIYTNGQCLFTQVCENFVCNKYEGNDFIVARKSNPSWPLLIFFCRECCYLKPSKKWPNATTSCRMQQSVCIPYLTNEASTKHEEMCKLCNTIIENLSDIFSSVKQESTSKMQIKARIEAIRRLNMLQGMKTFKSLIMLQLSALFGLIPVEYYNFADCGEGSLQYIKRLRQSYPDVYPATTTDVHVFDDICKACNKYYNRVNPAECENSLCVLKRKFSSGGKDRRKLDIIFKVKTSSGERVQDCYRVWKNRNGVFQLQVFDTSTKSFTLMDDIDEWPWQNTDLQLRFKNI